MISIYFSAMTVLLLWIFISHFKRS